ncbi:MAG: ATP-dependent Clp protease ATP-binding subunit, partial [Candidatus Peribacteraceae bacterium]|nr:ATP-dependent Clp protease ATP-binding subunit [Candidatus Peribacteraceae bacterium]
LTEAVRRKPYSVVLFDEIEKAHPEFFNLLLQILEDGVLTDGSGKQVDFRNTVIVMTSNVGAKKLTQQAAKIGFKVDDEAAKTEEKEYEARRQEVLSELKEHMRPEFLNRIDHIIVFNALTQAHIQKIVKIHLDAFRARLKGQGYQLKVSPKAVAHLGLHGFDPEYGARPVRRVIQERLEDELAEQILKGMFAPGDTVVIDVAEGDRLTFNRGESADKAVAAETAEVEEVTA